MQSGSSSDSRPRVLGCAGGLYCLLGTVLITALSLLALRLCAGVARDHPGEIDTASVLALTDRWYLVPLLALPALGMGVLLLRTKRAALMLLTVATLLMILPLAPALLALLRLIGPLYQYQEIG